MNEYVTCMSQYIPQYKCLKSVHVIMSHSVMIEHQCTEAAASRSSLFS